MKPRVTYIVAPIVEDFVSRWFYTMYKYSEPNSFRVIYIDQVDGGISRKLWDEIKDKVHLYIHPPHYEFGYAKGMNEGIIHALHWGTDLICPANDDIEIINSRWMEGIEQTFALDERIVGVVPMSPRIPGWGYGVKDNPDILPYKEEYTEEDYNYLLEGDFSDKDLPETFPRKIKGNVIDGSIFVMPYFKRKLFEEVGLMDEHYWPGGGEDVDMMARAYQKNLRIVSTTYSWIWHHLSQTKNLSIESKYYHPPHHHYWNNEKEIWPEGFDVWGLDKDKKNYPRVPEIYVDIPQ
jgi:GT2 family glycosyltransferase